MRYYLLLLLGLIIGVTQVGAQTLKKRASMPIFVGYDKTVHLIFPDKVKYSRSVDDLVAIDCPPEAQHIVRIKANTKDFSGTTTISVATEDGRFYSFVASYATRPTRTTYTQGNKEPSIETLEVSDSSDIHIIAPSKVVYIDLGSEDIEGSVAEGTDNIIQLKATKKFDDETNVSFATREGKFYTYNLVYKESLSDVLYSLQDSEEKVMLSEKKLVTKQDKPSLLKTILGKGRDFYSLGVKHSGIVLAVTNIYSQKDMIIFVLELENTTSIPYDIDYNKYSVVGRKKKKLVTQDVEQIPTFLSEPMVNIGAKQKSKYVVSFPRFTISEEQLFRIDIVEKNGGRNISYTIDASSIIEAKSL